MDLSFHISLAEGYKSPQQIARVLTEDWIGREAYCPNCGQPSISRRGNNSRIADFSCVGCMEEYEAKSLSRPFGNKMIDGEYGTLIRRLRSASNPNFFLLQYDRVDRKVLNFEVVPKHFFVPELVEARRPLPPHARRAGWTGCQILLTSIPKAGRIFLVRNGIAEPKDKVLSIWRQTIFLRDRTSAAAKGWLLAVMKCVDKIGRTAFAIDDLYVFESELRSMYPGNRHIRAKIRQQLQLLRDLGYLEFVGGGNYRLPLVGAHR